ncbi:MAG: DUF3237 domain-containing protein [Janthinobacterium lividum]
MNLSKPALRHVADIDVLVGEPVTVGQTPQGLRRIVPILGGSITGPEITAEILAVGADYQTIRDDGFSVLDARYAARLDNGSLIYIVNTGVRFGSQATMDAILRGESVDPESVYFRTTPKFETASPAHQWLVQPLFVATGARRPDSVALAVYQVD